MSIRCHRAVASYRLKGTFSTLACVALLTACNSDGARPEAWIGRVDTLGDTINVSTLRGPDTWPPINSGLLLDTVWSHDQLNRPTALAIANDTTFFVADGPLVHVVQSGGLRHSLIGRQGEGPGEFKSIHGLAAWGEDSLLVWDGALQRLTWLTPTGQVLRTLSVMPGIKYTGPRVVTLQVTAGKVLLAYGPGMISPGGTADSVVVNEVELNSGSSRRLASVEDVAWMNAQGAMGPADPFGPRALLAFGPGGLLALSDGVDYCILTIASDTSRSPLRICREWQPPATAVLSSPSAEDIQSLGQLGAMIERLTQAQHPSPRWNSVEEIVYDSRQRLWVRPVLNTYKFHPYWLGQLPRLRPPFYRWEVFDAHGKLYARYDLPSRFRPLAITDSNALGTVERDDGTVVIGRVGLRGIMNPE